MKLSIDLIKLKLKSFLILLPKKQSMKRKFDGRKKLLYKRRYPTPPNSDFHTNAERVQQKEEDRVAKEKRQKAEKAQRTYEDMYGREAVEKAKESKNEDYDPEEDFW